MGPWETTKGAFLTMRPGIALGLSMALTLGLTSAANSPARASDSEATDVQDVAGDANFLNVQKEVVTSPASYGAADLVSVDLQTAYESVSVGDGIDYRASALRIVFATTETPASLPPESQVTFRVSAGVAKLEGIVTKSPEGVVMATARLRRRASVCSNPGACWSHVRPEWTAQIHDQQKTLTLTYPLATLAPEEAALIGVDALLDLFQAETLLSLQSASTDVPQELRIDIARWGYGFVVGEDIPEDVACNEQCEQVELHSAAGFLWSDNNLDTLQAVGYINGVNKSTEEAHTVDVVLTITRCPSEGPCVDTVVTDHCEGTKCGIRRTIAYDPAETASYWFEFEWEFDDGDGWGFRFGKPCHEKFGLEECPDDSAESLRF